LWCILEEWGGGFDDNYEMFEGHRTDYSYCELDSTGRAGLSWRRCGFVGCALFVTLPVLMDMYTHSDSNDSFDDDGVLAGAG